MEDKGEISDGFHTFNELYEHRHMLFRALCRFNASRAWKSKKHHDGSCFKGWFIAGVFTPNDDECITYHVPMRLWKAFSANKTLKRAYRWDGHTSKDVIKRLKEF